MRISDIQIVGKRQVRATPAEVEALESKLWITFPPGYREYVTRLGEGVLGSLVRVHPPSRIERELSEWRRRIAKYWFWDAGRALLPQERALECVIIGDTVNGDELVFHPMRPSKLFVLPHESERVFEAGGDLLSAVDWMCGSGELAEPVNDRSFEPFDSRAEGSDDTGQGAAVDPGGESLDEIVETAKRWASRHSVRKRGAKEMRQHVPKGTEAELLNESIVIEGESSLDVGYSVAWRVVEKDGGREVGVFRWQMNEDSSGSAFEPAKRR